MHSYPCSTDKAFPKRKVDNEMLAEGIQML